jgi:hypothetical protein
MLRRNGSYDSLSSGSGSHLNVLGLIDTRSQPSGLDPLGKLTDFMFFNLICDILYLLISFKKVENSEA